ncbi:hypothetical protein F0344_12360 [Streptomyces finlayi]|uniref:Uncharacterized protein n=1 Tax=Streptomyces finlayi TaxID=67296 RepID=A0A7G7BIY7_9ACTN|nr:hypothetical protein [Streptomyces finlayi]QNE75302.1 hypothetical protein F0344_12360 [Streptomyces finlayi]
MTDDQRETYEYEIADGKVYIQIRQAERKTYTQYNGRSSSPAEEIQGRVWISTDPQFEGDTNLGFVKVRGRKYAIEHVVKRLRDGEGRLSLSEKRLTMHWSTESSYRGGYRNDQGGRVKYEAKAYGVLGEIEREALNRFEADHPDWQLVSARYLFENERDRALSKARSLREEAAKEEHRARQWEARIPAPLAV